MPYVQETIIYSITLESLPVVRHLVTGRELERKREREGENDRHKERRGTEKGLVKIIINGYDQYDYSFNLKRRRRWHLTETRRSVGSRS